MYFQIGNESCRKNWYQLDSSLFSGKWPIMLLVSELLLKATFLNCLSGMVVFTLKKNNKSQL